MQMLRVVFAVLVVSFFVGCASIKSMCSDNEVKVALSSVPKAVTDTASATLKGFTATEASMEKHEGRTVYELKGKADGQEYEIKITAEGKIIRLKLEEDED